MAYIIKHVTLLNYVNIRCSTVIPQWHLVICCKKMDRSSVTNENQKFLWIMHVCYMCINHVNDYCKYLLALGYINYAEHKWYVRRRIKKIIIQVYFSIIGRAESFSLRIWFLWRVLRIMCAFSGTDSKRLSRASFTCVCTYLNAQILNKNLINSFHGNLYSDMQLKHFCFKIKTLFYQCSDACYKAMSVSRDWLDFYHEYLYDCDNDLRI